MKRNEETQTFHVEYFAHACHGKNIKTSLYVYFSISLKMILHLCTSKTFIYKPLGGKKTDFVMYWQLAMNFPLMKFQDIDLICYSLAEEG